MFKSYLFENLYSNGYKFVIIDDDFTASIITQEEFLFDAIAKVYEERGLPVGHNLALAISQYRVLAGSDTDVLLYYATWNKKLIEYREEIERYLLLL
jgi:hypothetical protein